MILSKKSATFWDHALGKGFVDKVAIIRGADEIARHSRIHGRGQFVFDPKHYLALLEQKPGARRQACADCVNLSAQAAPLRNWALPEPLQHPRRLLEARMGNRGKREFIQVPRLQAPRLMEIFPLVDCRRRDDGRHPPHPRSAHADPPSQWWTPLIGS